MDAALIALPATALMTGGLIGFLVASIAYDRKDRAQPPVSLELPVTGSDDEGWTEPPRIMLSGDVTAEAYDRVQQSVAKLGAIGALARLEPASPAISSPDDPPAWLMAEHVELAASAIRHASQALAELARFQQEGPFSDRFPLEEDVEVLLAKALQDAINILLAYNPTEHERAELAQLEAAIFKFVSDYGA